MTTRRSEDDKSVAVVVDSQPSMAMRHSRGGGVA
jgi:hypothetical protein